MSAIRVLVADDHALVREGVRQVLSDPSAFDVVGEAASAGEALDLAEELRPDVVLLDVSMPGGSGLHAVGSFATRAPGTRVLMLSMHDDPEYVVGSVRAGAQGYVRKDSTPAELRAAVKSVHAGQVFFSAPLSGSIAAALRGDALLAATPAPSRVRVAEALTTREREVFMGIVRGSTNREIGAELRISTRTVEAHRESLTRKLGMRSVAELTRLALEQGFLETGA
jgi:two-component system nitrate/nitrite response regulator NarL